MKKSILIGTALMLCFISNSQKDNYNTRIGKSERVDISGGKTTIEKADSVFITSINSDLNERFKIYVYSFKQEFDSTLNLFKTEIFLNHPTVRTFENLILSFEFSDSVESAILNLVGMGVGSKYR